MSAAPLALALAAAVVHAAWNLALAGARDAEAATAVVLVLALVLWAAPAALAGGGDGAAVPYIAASAVLELAYFVALGAAYRRADLSVVYPMARGLGPLLLVVAAAAGLGGNAGAAQVAGVVAIVAGVLTVRGLGGGTRAVDLLLAAAIGCCLAV